MPMGLTAVVRTTRAPLLRALVGRNTMLLSNLYANLACTRGVVENLDTFRNKSFSVQMGSTNGLLCSQALERTRTKYCFDFRRLGYPLFKHGLGSNSNDFHFLQKRLFSSNSFNFSKHERKIVKKPHLIIRILKVMFLVTGASVWAILLVFFLMVDDVKFEKSDKDDLPSEPSAMVRNLKFLGVIQDERSADIEAIMLSDDDKLKHEIGEKLNAFNALWQKLSREEGVRVSLGNPVEICGYKCYDNASNTENAWDIEEEDRRNKWRANCYIEGKNGVGVLSILFERYHAESEWIATKVHLERVKASGEVICNVSSHLPNGIKNFTRLSDA